MHFVISIITGNFLKGNYCLFLDVDSVSFTTFQFIHCMHPSLHSFGFHPGKSSWTVSIPKCKTNGVTRLSRFMGAVPSATAAIPP